MRVTQMSASSRPHKVVDTVPAMPSVPSVARREHHRSIGDIFSELKKDDYILLGIIAVLIFEGCHDYILLAALGYLFIMGINFQKT